MTAPDARLLAYADGELTPADAAEVERDLLDQPDLRERLDEVRRFQERLRGGLPPAPVYDPARRPGLAAGLAFVANAGRAQRRWRTVRFAAAACLLVGVGMLTVMAAPRTNGTKPATMAIIFSGGNMATVSLPPDKPTANGLGWDYDGRTLYRERSPLNLQGKTWKDNDGGASLDAASSGIDALKSDGDLKGGEEAPQGGDASSVAMGSRRFAAPLHSVDGKVTFDEEGRLRTVDEFTGTWRLDGSRNQTKELQHSASVADSVQNRLNITLAEVEDDLAKPFFDSVTAAPGAALDATPASDVNIHEPGGTGSRLLNPIAGDALAKKATADSRQTESTRKPKVWSEVGAGANPASVSGAEADRGRGHHEGVDKLPGKASPAGPATAPKQTHTALIPQTQPPVDPNDRQGRNDFKLAPIPQAGAHVPEVTMFNGQQAHTVRLPIPTNPWTLAERDARSTFALDTDRASYALARRHLDAGTRPPPATVRIEEFVNAFDYHDHAPEVETFALRAEAASAPFRQGATLLRLGLKGKVIGRDGRRPAHLVLVVDGSGSMDRPDRGAVAKAGLAAALAALAPQDRVTVVAFAEEARLLAEALPASDPALTRALDAIPAQGASNLAAGLALGYAQAARTYRPGAVNRVVLVSDGIANLGETGLDQLVAAAEANRRLGIATTTVGVGAGSYDDALLARLAKRGDGHYLRLDADAESRAAFVADLGAGLGTIAADAKIQVVFDPARVRRWRLLGYEQRALAHQDFTNDAVDAGEVGSGQAATALYELELVGDAGTDLGSVKVRYRDPADGAVKELAWRLAGDLPRPRSVSEAPAFHLAAAAAEFAELLRGSEHAADGSFPPLIALLERVAAVWPHDAAVADLLRLARAAPGLPPAP